MERSEQAHNVLFCLQMSGNTEMCERSCPTELTKSDFALIETATMKEPTSTVRTISSIYQIPYTYAKLPSLLNGNVF